MGEIGLEGVLVGCVLELRISNPRKVAQVREYFKETVVEVP